MKNVEAALEIDDALRVEEGDGRDVVFRSVARRLR
jgi:hypothetical protein